MSAPPRPTTGVGVRVSGLDVTIGSTEILRGVDLTLQPGRITVLTGPSGSGKTTLLTAVAGLQTVSAGDIVFEADGVPLPRHDVRIGLVHQALALLALLSARENVELAAQLAHHRRRELMAETQELLLAVGLDKRGRHLVQELSGGEQQRVAIARALIVRPQVLLADEPTSQLDAESRASVLGLLRRTADDGVAVVVATHDLEVAAWGDRHVEMVAGRLVEPFDGRGGRHRSS